MYDKEITVKNRIQKFGDEMVTLTVARLVRETLVIKHFM